MMALPTGTVAFLFTDIEGSTRLLHALGEHYRAMQGRHSDIVTAAVDAADGHLVRTVGDSFFVTFRSAVSAVRAAVAVQRNLATSDWPEGVTLRVRMGLHTGQGVLGGDDYIGIDVNLAARIAAAAHGGQVLLSDATRVLTQRDLPDGVAVRDLGEHRLRDIAHTEHLFDVVIDGLPSDFPPIRSLDARSNNLPLQLTSFVGRADEIAQAQGRHERALRLLGVTEVIRRSIEGGYPLHGTNVTGIDVLSEGRKAIGDEAVDRALAEGRSMSRAEAVAYATESE